MIPLHRPPFGLGTAMVSSLTNGKSKSIEALEQAYAQVAGCPYAVWLPSARAGICWALRVSIGERTKIVGPAFTCSVVHEAMARSGGAMELIDAAAEGFLMQPEALADSRSGTHALVFCETYGHCYERTQLEGEGSAAATVRIIDMAMSVPQRMLFERFRGNDFAVISFGAAKSMYAGWGAMGFTRDEGLAGAV